MINKVIIKEIEKRISVVVFSKGVVVNIDGILPPKDIKGLVGIDKVIDQKIFKRTSVTFNKEEI